MPDPTVVYQDDQGRLRDAGSGQFAADPYADDVESEPDERCPNGCERYGDWWSVPVDCPVHLL